MSQFRLAVEGRTVDVDELNDVAMAALIRGNARLVAAPDPYAPDRQASGVDLRDIDTVGDVLALTEED